MENMNNTVVETNVGGTNNSSSNYRVELVATIGGDGSSNNNNSKINVIFIIRFIHHFKTSNFSKYIEIPSTVIFRT